MGKIAADVMIRLFGRPFVTLSGVPAAAFPSSGFLILALLRRRFDRMAARTQIAALLREEEASDSANNFLRQVISRIRRWEQSSGLDALRCNGNDIWTDDNTIPTDLDAFLAIEQVETEADLRALMNLYRGDFLAGLDPAGEELTQWVRVERTALFDRFVRLAVDGATRLGGSICAETLSRLELLAPGDDSVARARRLQRHSIAVPASAPSIREHAAGAGDAALRRPLDGMPQLAMFPPAADVRGLGPTQLLLASSLIEDITLDLCRLKTVAVLAPHTMLILSRSGHAQALPTVPVDYAVHTKVLPSSTATEIQAAISVVHHQSHRLLWTAEYRVKLSDTPARQIEIATGIADTILDSVAQSELSRLSETLEPSAYLWYLLARRSMKSLDLKSVRRSRNALRKAIELAPRFAPALALHARALSQEWLLLGRPEKDLLWEAERLAKLAIEHDPLDSSGYRELGKAALFLRGADESLHHYRIAERIAPHHADLLADFADTLCHRSDLDAARRRLDLAFALNPLAPDEYFWTSGAIQFFQGEYQAALCTFMRMREKEPAARLISAAAAMSGQRDIARHYRDVELANHSDFTVAGWLSIMPQDNPSHAATYADALRLAGFP